MNQTNNHKKYFKTNNSFYANIGVNAGFSRSKSETDSHTESAVVSTITGKNPNSTITYNNVRNIMYQGTQAKDTSAVYNNVEIKNSNGGKEYVLQPLLPSETNSLWFEKMTMDKFYGKNNQNLRFYYHKDLIGKEKRFKSLKELRDFFNKGENLK